MGIETTNAPSQVAVTFNKLHMARLEIDQPVFEDDALTPKYSVKLVFRRYGVVEGVRHYSPAELVIGVSDFIALATQKAQAGDMTLVGALQSIEQACAAIYSDHTGNTASVV